MNIIRLLRNLTMAAVAVTLVAEPMAVYSEPQAKTASASKKKKSGGNKRNSNAKKSSGTKAKGASKKTTSKKSAAKKETSADMKRRQQATQKEIKLTEEQIRENERKISSGVADLGRIDADIQIRRQQVDEISKEVKRLEGSISSLQGEIEKNNARLAILREKYLKAVKKMRATKGKQSDLSFLFSSDNFNQAMRRMRYLRQFSRWKDRQTEEINKRVDQLKYQSELLAQTKREKDVALGKEVKARNELQVQRDKQDRIVADLRANGNALKAHLSKKQAEANSLRNSIAALIAEEQRREEQRRREEQARVEAERKRKEAEAAKAEEERIAREKQLAEQRESNRKESEKAAKKEKAAQEKAAKEKSAKEKAAKEKAAKEAKKKNDKTANSKNYAEARKRKPRSEGKGSAQEKKSTPATPSATNSSDFGNFEAAKGSLPTPVTGSFRITSPFGPHALPDLPDVVYDNPGIDAESSAGSSARAVFRGKVSGVYMLPGYSTVIIVSHGKYYTVYGNIASPAVKVGDVVKQGQSLGGLAKDDSGHVSIHFEVWKNREKLNPAAWIGR